MIKRVKPVRKRSKYGNKKVTLKGIEFDSLAESRYYLVLLDKKKKGEIKEIELQPRFLLQDKFRKNGKGYRKIEYVADFKVTYSDGRIEIIDVKGMETKEFKIKHKLFEYKYPELSLVLIKSR